MDQEEQRIVVGIDVSKARLDVAAGGEEWPVTNDLDGISRLISRLQTLNPGLTVVESTGGLERLKGERVNGVTHRSLLDGL